MHILNAQEHPGTGGFSPECCPVRWPLLGAEPMPEFDRNGNADETYR
jgi:hypothetical protein